MGAKEVEDDGVPFEEKMQRLTGELEGQIKFNLEGLGYEI